MKLVLIVIATIAAVSCSKSESAPEQTCWSCNLQDPLSGMRDHVDTCLNGTIPPIVIVVNGVAYGANCVEQ